MSPWFSRPALPLDIVYAVLEQLELPQDSGTLSACSQVCGDWLPVARKYLFARVTVRPRGDDADEPPQYWEVFHDHFLKPIHSNPAFVTHLSLVGSFTQNLDFDRLAPVLASFPILKHLCIQSWNVLALEKPVQPIAPRLCLETLEIRDLMCYTGSTEANHGDIAPQRLLNLLYHVPRAKKVTFSNVPVVYNVPPAAEPNLIHLDIPGDFAPPSVHLSSGRTDNHFMLHLLERARSTPRTLRSLHIAFDEFTHVVSSVARLLNAARNLEVLELDFSDLEEYGAETFMHHMRASDSLAYHLSPVLRRNTSLRSVVLIVPRAPSKYWAMCLRLLSSLSPSVRTVELHVDFDSTMELPLAKLRKRLSGVEVARVVLKGCPIGEVEEKRTAWSEYLHGGLSSLVNRGALQVQFLPSGM